MEFGDRLRRARKSHGYTQRELADKIGAKHNSVSNWEKGRNMPDTATFKMICNILDLSSFFLLTGEDLPSSLPGLTTFFSAAELEMIKKYRMLDAYGKGAVDSLLNYYCGLKIPPKNVGARLPDKAPPPVVEMISGLISVQGVAAGWGTYLGPEGFDTIKLQKNHLTRKASFYVPVEGDSMEPKFHNGDILIVEKSPVTEGEIGIFTLDNHGYVKICGNGELISLNPEYEPIPMNEDIICNGRVIGVLDPEWIV